MGSFKQPKMKSKEAKSLSLLGMSRKQIRKEIRMRKKIGNSVHLTKSNELCARAHTGRLSKTIDGSDNETINKTANKIENIKKESQKNTKVTEDCRGAQFDNGRRNKKIKLLKEANVEEDKIIQKLGKQLKLNRRKKDTIPKSFAADGLDDLLDFCLEKDRKYMIDTDSKIIGKELDANILDTHKENICEVDRPSNVHKQSPNKDTRSSDIITKEQYSNDYSSNRVLQTEASKIAKTKLLQAKKTDNFISNNKDLREDIYGRKRDMDGNIVDNIDIGKYIPPAARLTMQNNHVLDENLYLLKKQLKGCLNRVTEQNIYHIANQIETMYMTNSRNNMNYVLSELIFESLILPIITPDRLVCEHMMLIVILHANIGIEVGTNFLEKLVKKFVGKMKDLRNVEDKELDNMVLMISHLYNFQVFGNKLLYQIFQRLMVKFTEKEIELILLFLKTVGFSLRKDDPNALKAFIQNLQDKARDENGKNSRVKFMLEILLAIKNNNMNKIPQYDPSHVEHLKKIMKNVIRKGNTVMRINLSLGDLLHADEKGKWWIVGSAWMGSSSMNSIASMEEQNKHNFGEKILKLAQRQRMNTDIRKNIFCILMTAEDYLDAFEKLHHLGLKDQQEGEIIHVVMHCCLHENKFNPYYAVLAEKLCCYNRKYQLTIQYSVWDKLKTLKTYESKQLSNLAQFLTQLLIEKCLALSILKIIQFTELNKQTVKFLKQILMGILLYENEEACLQVFKRISVSPQLYAFRESLRLFLNCFVIKNIDSCNILDEQKVMLRKRAEFVDKILTSHGSRLVF